VAPPAGDRHPSGVTGVERRAVREAGFGPGPGRCSLIDEPVAAADSARPAPVTRTRSAIFDRGHRGGTT